MKQFLFGGVCIFMLLAGCNNDKAVETTTEEPVVQEPAEQQEQELEEEPSPFLHTFPLTGEGTDEAVDHRVIGIMIENSKSARPQSGLYQADLVYEVLAEGSITRLLAFYHSEQPEVIGPVRSARDYYVHLNNGYDAIYVSAGGSPDALAMVEKGQVDHISGLAYDGKYFHRSSARKAPHNMYTSHEKLTKAIEEKGHHTAFNITSLPFLKEDESGNIDDPMAITATEVEINYGSATNNVMYQYDEERNQYLRFNGGVQIVDLENGEPVAATNLFIVEMSHKVIDNAGRRDINLTSGGQALLVQNGQAQKVEWKNVDGQILPYKDGEPLYFVKGKTWINIIPTNPGVENVVIN